MEMQGLKGSSSTQHSPERSDRNDNSRAFSLVHITDEGTGCQKYNDPVRLADNLFSFPFDYNVRG
jgi:hypothetical protein